MKDIIVVIGEPQSDILPIEIVEIVNSPHPSLEESSAFKALQHLIKAMEYLRPYQTNKAKARTNKLLRKTKKKNNDKK